MDEQRRKRIVRHHLRCLGRLGVSTGPKRISADGVAAKPGRPSKAKTKKPEQASFSLDHKSIEIAVRPRKGSAAICSRCHQPAPGDEQLAERRFEVIPFSRFFVSLLNSV